ncbi:MAG: hypothetical protein PHG14_01870 [Desulfobacter postgatei]|uniref:hypothetical protein n=1 Tax=Desulfobacter postgatei TaxID=2293 RepID=UPI0023F377E1|nr:hypothetical protein [Desulfobacter postgatei]MDD4272454.1 hypothetical protein [Desulfobacter postgatei]
MYIEISKGRSQFFVQMVKYHHKNCDISPQKQDTLPRKRKDGDKNDKGHKKWGKPVKCTLDRAFATSGLLLIFSLIPE